MKNCDSVLKARRLHAELTIAIKGVASFGSIRSWCSVACKLAKPSSSARVGEWCIRCRQPHVVTQIQRISFIDEAESVADPAREEHIIRGDLDGAGEYVIALPFDVLNNP